MTPGARSDVPTRSPLRFGWRAQIRLICFSAAVFVVLGGLAASGWYQAHVYARYIEYGYQNSFQELVGGVDAIDTALRKSSYTRSPVMLASLGAEVSRNASSAAASLVRLPFSYEELEHTAAFLSQAGDYAAVLARKSASGQSLSREETDNLHHLSRTARTLSEQLSRLQSIISEENLRIGQIEASVLSGGGTEAVALLSGAFKDIEQDFPETPSLVYDGPFSSHIERLTPVYLELFQEVDAAAAKARAAAFLDVQENQLTSAGVSEGRIPTFMFSGHLDGGEVWIEVSSRGGQVVSMVNSRAVGESRLTVDEALSKAQEFLTAQGFPGMTHSYHLQTSGGLLITYVCKQDDVLVYPDLIEICIAPDTGRVTLFSSVGYLMNHRETREVPEENMGGYRADGLTDKGRCIIPTDGQNELACRQYEGVDAEGRKFLIFVNLATGAEEKIMILVEDETGTLAI